jgi:hypothetical protein
MTYTKKMHQNSIFLQKNLHISKKSSTFAPAFGSREEILEKKRFRLPAFGSREEILEKKRFRLPAFVKDDNRKS